ncbi:MAG: formylglycine-generating enzyme family protein [Rhodospirillaceae bacterium]|nr:formylglycine-generating enzyme family protein [Rhodospirillaceae bacterium]
MDARNGKRLGLVCDAAGARVQRALRLLLIAVAALGLLIVLPWSAAADLDPSIQADLHLVEAEDYIKQKNYAAAQEAMGKILALQQKHDLTIPVEFHFKYAQVLGLAGQYDEAVAAVTYYLQTAGRGAAHYRDALSLLHTASQNAEEEKAANPAFTVARNMKMVVVPAGSYLMGRDYGEGPLSHLGPMHRVTIREPFAVGMYEVTFEEWDACVRAGGCGGYAPDDEGWGRGRRPVVNVSWVDAQRFVEWLRHETGEPYRLLSEAEWEYVARAGTTTRFHTGSTISTSQANYDGNYTTANGDTGVFRRQTVEVGSFPPNSFGLYDVHGNVWEWVEDCFRDTYRGAPSDGSSWTSGDCSRRVTRGGSWNDAPVFLRSEFRSGYDSKHRTIGFRVARTLTP